MAGRNTAQKLIVSNALKELANHPTADEVYALVHEQHPSISKATVYRTLNKMADEGEALHVRINNGADHFDHMTMLHYHVRCEVCGKVDDVMIPYFQDLNDRASEACDYQITGHQLQFDGICPACQEAQRQESEVKDGR